MTAPARPATVRVDRPCHYDLVLLDIDGVLVHSRPTMEQAWAAVRRDLDVAVPFSAYFELIGRPFPDIIRLLGLARMTSQIQAVYTAAATDHSGLARPYAGIETALATLVTRGARLGVVTSKDASRTRVTLAGLGTSFATVRTPDDGVPGKPAPDLLLAALADARSDPADAVYVGDMSVDHEAACRAGIAFAHAAWGYGSVEAPCRRLTRTSELASL